MEIAIAAVALLIAIWQLQLQRREIRRSSRVNLLIHTSTVVTVNAGHAQAKATNVNGLESRFNAYISALYVLADAPAFPDNLGANKQKPVNFVPRR